MTGLPRTLSTLRGPHDLVPSYTLHPTHYTLHPYTLHHYTLHHYTLHPYTLHHHLNQERGFWLSRPFQSWKLNSPLPSESLATLPMVARVETFWPAFTEAEARLQ